MTNDQIDPVTQYGFKRMYNRPGRIGVRCIPCGATFPKADGSVMRSHARECPVAPRSYYVPARCWS